MTYICITFNSAEDSIFGLTIPINSRDRLFYRLFRTSVNWIDVLKDIVLTTALLDRILCGCEIIKLTGNSYRMENRKNIFENKINTKI